MGTRREEQAWPLSLGTEPLNVYVSSGALVTGPQAPSRSEGMLGRRAPSPVRHLKVARTEKCA